MNKVKLLFFDIETAPNLAYVWEKYEQDVLEFKKERHLLAFAYKWDGEKIVQSFSLAESRPRDLVRKLHSLFDKADIICGHNIDQFDIKMSNAFFAKHRLKPPSPYKTIDTLKIARSKFRFNSNKLNDLGEYLGIGGKIDTGGFKLWDGCLKKDPGAWKKMKKYNRRDVILLEKVFRRLFPWATNVVNLNIREGIFCPYCQSSNMWARGELITTNFRRQRYQCKDCGHWSCGKRKKFREISCS